jgi:hypothetical protein
MDTKAATIVRQNWRNVRLAKKKLIVEIANWKNFVNLCHFHAKISITVATSS